MAAGSSSRQANADADAEPPTPSPWEELRRASVHQFGSRSPPVVPPLVIPARGDGDGGAPAAEEEKHVGLTARALAEIENMLDA